MDKKVADKPANPTDEAEFAGGLATTPVGDGEEGVVDVFGEGEGEGDVGDVEGGFAEEGEVAVDGGVAEDGGVAVDVSPVTLTRSFWPLLQWPVNVQM